MKILRIADVADNRTGGMTRAMYGTGDVLVKAGHQVDYIFSDQFHTRGPVQLRRFSVPLKVSVLVRQLQRQGKQYDIVEIHEPLAAVACFLRPLLKGFPPIVLFSHGLEERSRLVDLEYCKQKGLPVSLKKRYSPLSVVLQARYGTRHCSQVICLNSRDFKHLIQSGVAENRVTQIQNGVEEELLAISEAMQEDPGRSGVLFVGSWLVRKGILDLVPAMTELLRRHVEIRFTIAGSGAAADVVLRDFAPDVQERIAVIPKFAGNAALVDLYRQHSVLVLPSYFEGQPLVMLEAAAFGMAIVATNIGGIADFVEDRKNGLLVEVGNPGDLASKLEKVSTDCQFARHLGSAARATVETYTWTQSAHLTLQAYEKAIQVAGQKKH